MRSIRPSAALAAFLASTLQAGPAAGEAAQHCVARLEPVEVHGTTIEAELVELGCYATYAEALEVGTGGAVTVGAGETPSSLSDADLDASSVSGEVVIGTEWVETGYANSSKSYTASATCSANLSWAVDSVGSTWNDQFESGKGFGGCDRNRKFQHADFGGASVLCTPNCNTYGSLNNQVSSLRWTH